MEEADDLCQRVGFMTEGKLVALDEPRELKLRYGQRTAKVCSRIAKNTKSGSMIPRTPVASKAG